VAFRHGAKGYARFGPQPIRRWMDETRWSCARLADQVGVSYHHLYLAITGKTAPSAILRDSLPAVLGVKLAFLFTPESLAAEPVPHKPHSNKKRAA
jgi:hypothetical protein